MFGQSILKYNGNFLALEDSPPSGLVHLAREDLTLISGYLAGFLLISEDWYI